jgi:hypothetical protein
MACFLGVLLVLVAVHISLAAFFLSFFIFLASLISGFVILVFLCVVCLTDPIVFFQGFYNSLL